MVIVSFSLVFPSKLNSAVLLNKDKTEVDANKIRQQERSQSTISIHILQNNIEKERFSAENLPVKGKCFSERTFRPKQIL